MRDPKEIPIYDPTTAQDMDSAEPQFKFYKIDDRFWILCEPDAADAASFRSAAARCARMVDGSVVGVDGVGELSLFLVGRCLWECNSDTKRALRPVTPQELRKWGDKVVNQIFEDAKEMGGLNDRDPHLNLLKDALGTSDSPLSLDNLRTFVNGLPDAEFRRLKVWLKPTAQEQAKNSPPATTGTTDLPGN